MATTPSKRRSRSRSCRRRARTEWHPPFCALVEWRCPRWVRVEPEVLLQRQSQRIDLLLSYAGATNEKPGAILDRLMQYCRRFSLEGESRRTGQAARAAAQRQKTVKEEAKTN